MAPSSFQIREITTEAEVRLGVEVIRRAFQTVADEFGITEANCPYYSGFTTYEHMCEYRQPGEQYFGLFDGDRMVGSVTACVSEGACEFGKLAVLPEYRHSGCGRLLIEFVIDYARRAGAERVTMGLMNTNMQLKRWYEILGFHETSVEQYDWFPFPICRMEMRLPQEQPANTSTKEI